MRQGKYLINIIFFIFISSLPNFCYPDENYNLKLSKESEPLTISWKVLEGVTEPFETNEEGFIPLWKQIKNSADQKAASKLLQQALSQYGQIIKSPHIFSQMPPDSRYDVFLSMSRLLGIMGFHQRAEMLLYEAMAYNKSPFEAHMQLSLLLLDKEDIENAKIHLKNCLFFRESDVMILTYLSTILIAEGKVYEAKFFLSRILSSLENRVSKLNFLLSDSQKKNLVDDMNYKDLTNWIEDLVIKVLYGEFRITPTATFELFKHISGLYKWVSQGEMSGRYLFDLGQSLYEGGRPKIGRIMMKRGYETSNKQSEGEVSLELIKMRIAFDFPVVPDSISNIIDSYINTTTYLSDSSDTYKLIDIENMMDMYWPLPLLAWSGVAITPIIQELLWRFSDNIVRKDIKAQSWVSQFSYDLILDKYHQKIDIFSEYFNPPRSKLSLACSEKKDGSNFNQNECKIRIQELNKASLQSKFFFDFTDSVSGYEEIKQRNNLVKDGIKTIVVPPSVDVKIEVGILGGHMNNHPVGQTVLRRILVMMNKDSSNDIDWSEFINLNLIALPLVPDAVTKNIASRVSKIINLPMDMTQAWKIIDGLHLDIIFFPDWQPFPDQQSILLQSRRMAPVQVCFYTRGTSCPGSQIDYYLLPYELENFYKNSVPASDINSKFLFHPKETNSSSHFDFNSQNEYEEMKKTVKKSIRPKWKESFSEQVILLDWPIINPKSIKDTAKLAVSKGPLSSKRGQKFFDEKGSDLAMEELSSLVYSPLENEGKVFFDGQPVAILPFYPTFIHPLMDDVIFEIMGSNPSLQVIIALPNSFLSHVKHQKHKLSWARKLVRRLWQRSGNLFNRLRLLPNPIPDDRLLLLLRQADIVLDSFPIGAPSHFLSLATSVGTPVVTMLPGTILKTPNKYLMPIRQKIRNLMNKNESTSIFKNPMARELLKYDIPWVPCSSSIAGFYTTINMSSYFVANSTLEYYELANNLISEREFSYELRVKLLEAIDEAKTSDSLSNKSTKGPQFAPKTENNLLFQKKLEKEFILAEDSCKFCVDDLGRLILSLGTPWARARLGIDQLDFQLKNDKDIKSKKRKKRTSSTEDFFQFSSGAIV